LKRTHVTGRGACYNAARRWADAAAGAALALVVLLAVLKHILLMLLARCNSDVPCHSTSTVYALASMRVTMQPNDWQPLLLAQPQQRGYEILNNEFTYC
jgi:hypothetical protein